MESTLELVEEKHGKIMVVGLKGTLDINTANQVEKKLHALIEEGEKSLALDFSGVDYLSSSGLRVLHMASVRAKNRQGQIVFCCLNERVKSVFVTSGFSQILTIYPSQEEAIGHFQQKSPSGNEEMGQ
jgi:anti-sigma B factor antagonist